MLPLDISRMENVGLVSTEQNSSKLWHSRYGHLSAKGLRLLSNKDMVHGLPQIDQLEVCEACIHGKQNRRAFPSNANWRASTPLELIHADVCGPMQTTSLGGNKYYLLFTDDYTRMSWVYFIKFKFQVFEQFRRFKSLVEKEFGRNIKVLHSDRGGEFLSNEFKIFCAENGIQRQLTTPYTLEQNVVAERKNRTVVEMARSLLKEKDLPNYLWVEAVAATVHLLNISPTRAVQDITPFEAWKGMKPTVSYLRIFGCIPYSMINRQKLDEKLVKCIFIGNSIESKAYNLFNPVNGRVIISRDVMFNEDAKWDWNTEVKT